VPEAAAPEKDAAAPEKDAAAAVTKVAAAETEKAAAQKMQLRTWVQQDSMQQQQEKKYEVPGVQTWRSDRQCEWHIDRVWLTDE